jgi:hypothetical protein
VPRVGRIDPPTPPPIEFVPVNDKMRPFFVHCMGKKHSGTDSLHRWEMETKGVILTASG